MITWAGPVLVMSSASGLVLFYFLLFFDFLVVRFSSPMVISGLALHKGRPDCTKWHASKGYQQLYMIEHSKLGKEFASQRGLGVTNSIWKIDVILPSNSNW
jgi:hypothetical protein